MGRSKKKPIKIDRESLVIFLDSVIEHRFFKSIAISIIVIFLTLHAFAYVKDWINDYKDKTRFSGESKVVRIRISPDSPSIVENKIEEKILQKGDSLTRILANLGVLDAEIVKITSAIKSVFFLNSLGSGDKIIIKYQATISKDSTEDKSNEENSPTLISEIILTPSPEYKIVLTRTSKGTYHAERKEAKLSKSISRYFGTIKNGLYIDGIRAGISPNAMMAMIDLYGYDLDFQRDLKTGDKFEMLIESFYDESGKKVRDGNVIFASLGLNNRVIETYSYKIGNKVEYFDSKGGSVKKSLLKTPINGARVSSGFGLRRHPILGYSKMHKGTDFAANSGTPILAAGSGVIAYLGVKGGYGNYVQIKHNKDYATAYAHVSAFNRKFRVGAKVTQGEIIAYVGSTGRSTGPHLHFEVLFKGEQIDPNKAKVTSGITLLGGDLMKFKASKAEMDRYRKNMPNLFK